MPKRIDKLTPEQEAQMDAWADRWIAVGLRTGEADWERFEASAKRCYEFAGIPWPGVVVRVANPLIGALAASRAEAILRSVAVDGAVDGAVRGAVDGAVTGAVTGAVDVAVADAVRGAVRGAVTGAVHVAVAGAVRGAVYVAVHVAVAGAVAGAVRGAVRGAVADAVDGAVTGAVDVAVADAVRGAVAGAVRGAEWHTCIDGQFWAGGWWGPAWVSFFREVCGLELDGDLWDRADALQGTTESACWWWPNRRFVMVCDRPKAINLEQIGPRGWGSHQLHCDNGPSIAWEGYELWHIHGVQVTEQIVMRPETLTPEQILGERNAEVRRVMLDRHGRDRLMAQVQPEVLDEDTDEVGHRRRLLRLTIEEDEPVVMLELVNSTQEPDGSWHNYLMPVPPDAKTAYSARCWSDRKDKPCAGQPAPKPLPKWTCQAAVAWQWGLLPEDYRVGAAS